ncbi:MAG: alpha/beta hydrolase-fold protein [Bacteroidia bacterium]
MYRLAAYALLLLLFGWTCQPPAGEATLPRVAAGTLQRIEAFASAHVDPRRVDVWLPEGYDAAQTYDVLYMHDGQMLFDSATTWNHQEWGVDEVVSGLIAQGRIRPCIVVGVWNNGDKRWQEYFPQKAYDRLPDTTLARIRREAAARQNTSPPVSDAYLRFLVGELKPYIDSAYATNPDPAHTFVAGSSMGGLISMYALCEYPEVFGGAACLSTHWVGIYTAVGNPAPAALLGYLHEHLPDTAMHRQFYFDYGTATLDSLYPPHQAVADSIMRAAGYGDDLWMTRAFPGEGHTERAWNRRLDIPLTFLLGR